MMILFAIGLGLPPLIIFWRGRNESRLEVYGRYCAAVLIVWGVLIFATVLDTNARVRHAQLIGDTDTAIADTGENVAAMTFGWIPGLSYGLILAGIRWLFHVCSRNKFADSVA